jgi:2,4-dienoyl-CoA reductase-like NADH-dependent reductase (Old Yellow Enzyme family)
MDFVFFPLLHRSNYKRLSLVFRIQIISDGNSHVFVSRFFMPELFETTRINTLSLKNRFVRSATWEGMAGDDGSATTRLVDLMKNLALGGVGLIITGHAFINREGRAGIKQLGVYDDGLIPGLSEMSDAVHGAGGRIVMQIAHAGCEAPIALTGRQPVGPSPMQNQDGETCGGMSPADIQKVIRDFALGALRAMKAGFDGIQIHAAHGYLLSQFLSPFYNKRKDEYGGSLENRARIVLEIFQRIRAATGDHFPVMIKINSEDFLDEGLGRDEMLQAAEMLEEAGMDAVELSGGTRYSGKCVPVRMENIDSVSKEVFYLEAAESYKQKIRTPLMLVGGIRSYGVAEKLVKQGVADYISLCRPLIREPELINRWASGDTKSSACRSDNRCFEPIRSGKGLYCVREARRQTR